MADVPVGYNPESILDTPDQVTTVLRVQGGGARIQSGGDGTVISTSIDSIATTVRDPGAPGQGTTGQGAPGPKLVKLGKGFRVRVPDDSIKEEIMNLNFTPEEERLFEDYLKFNNAFIKSHILSSPQTKQDFYDFWKLFVEKDGTDGYTLMTKAEGKELQKYMEDIVYAHRDYLIKSALRLLRKQDNPQHFQDITYPQEEEGFILFEEVKPSKPRTSSSIQTQTAPFEEDNDDDEDDDEDYTDEDEEEDDDDDEDDEEEEEDEEDEDEEDEDEEEEEEGEEEKKREQKKKDRKIKNTLSHIHKRIITVGSSDTAEVKVIKVLDYLIARFEYAGDDNVISFLEEYIGCKKSLAGRIQNCSHRIDIGRGKVSCRNFLIDFDKELTKLDNPSYNEYKNVLKWSIENLYKAETSDDTYKEILKSRLVYFYSRFTVKIYRLSKNDTSLIGSCTPSKTINPF